MALTLDLSKDDSDDMIMPTERESEKKQTKNIPKFHEFTHRKEDLDRYPTAMPSSKRALMLSKISPLPSKPAIPYFESGPESKISRHDLKKTINLTSVTDSNNVPSAYLY